jgi:hypothetical protein
VGVTFGIGSGKGVGRVIGGCPVTTGGGTGEGGGTGCPDAVGSSAGCDLVVMFDGPTGFELSLQAIASSESTTARTIPHADGRNGASNVGIAEICMRLMKILR